MSENYGDATRVPNAGSDNVSGAADDTVESVGRSDAEADAARSGADVDSDGLGGFGVGLADDGATTDSDGVPVGVADAEADAIRSGADVDDGL